MVFTGVKCAVEALLARINCEGLAIVPGFQHSAFGKAPEARSRRAGVTPRNGECRDRSGAEWVCVRYSVGGNEGATADSNGDPPNRWVRNPMGCGR